MAAPGQAIQSPLSSGQSGGEKTKRYPWVGDCQAGTGTLVHLGCSFSFLSRSPSSHLLPFLFFLPFQYQFILVFLPFSFSLSSINLFPFPFFPYFFLASALGLFFVCFVLFSVLSHLFSPFLLAVGDFAALPSTSCWMHSKAQAPQANAEEHL